MAAYWASDTVVYNVPALQPLKVLITPTLEFCKVTSPQVDGVEANPVICTYPPEYVKLAVPEPKQPVIGTDLGEVFGGVGPGGVFGVVGPGGVGPGPGPGGVGPGPGPGGVTLHSIVEDAKVMALKFERVQPPDGPPK